MQESLVFRPLAVSRVVKISCQVSMDRECRRGASDHDYKQPQSHRGGIDRVCHEMAGECEENWQTQDMSELVEYGVCHGMAGECEVRPSSWCAQ